MSGVAPRTRALLEGSIAPNLDAHGLAQRVGPAYGCVGFGLARYFASQGAGRLVGVHGAGLSR